MSTSALAGDAPASAETPSANAYTATRARRVRGGTAAADALTAAGVVGKMAPLQPQPSRPQPIAARAQRRVHRVASAEQLLLLPELLGSSSAASLPSPPLLPATPAGKECAMEAEEVLSASGGGSLSAEEGGGNNSSSSSLPPLPSPLPPLPPVAVAAAAARLPPPSPSTATSSSPRKRAAASERSSSQSAARPRGPPPAASAAALAFTSAFAPMASLPLLPSASPPKSAAALAADAAARAAAVAWAEAHAKARRAAALVAAAVPVPVGGSLRSAATAPCEIGGSGRRGSCGSFGSGSHSLIVGGSLNGIGKAPRVTKRVGASAAKQQRAAAVAAAAAAAARAAAAVAQQQQQQNASSSLYFGYGELSASQHDVLVRHAEEEGRFNDLAAAGGEGSSSHQIQQRLRQQEHVLVGARVAVHSPRDGAFFRATVRDVGSAAGAATGRGLPPGAALLVYDDGKAEVAHLGSRRFRLLAPRAASAGCGAGLLAAASAAGAEGLRLDADCAPAPLGAGLPAGPESARRGASLLLRSPVAVCGSDDDGLADKFELGNNYLSSSSAGAAALSSSSAWCRADVVGVDRAARRVRVLYADGEDEWIDLAAESVRGAARVAPLGTLWQPLAPGLAPGAARPEGAAAVGWRVALYCSREAAFFAADVTGFDSRTGLHRLAYGDGSVAVEDARLDAEAMKWVAAPTAATATINMTLSHPPHSPAVPTTAVLLSPPSPDACRAGSSSFSADGNNNGSENENSASGAAAAYRASDTNLAAYGSLGSVSCDAAAAAVAALAASQRDAVAVAVAAAAAAATVGAAANASWGQQDPMNADDDGCCDPWGPAGCDDNDASAPASAAAAACWWKGDGASAAAGGVARLTLGTGLAAAAAAASNVCLLPSTASEEDGDSKASAVSCDGDGGSGRGGSSSPPTATTTAEMFAAAPAAAPRLAGSSIEEGSVHGSAAAANAVGPLAAAANRLDDDDFHGGALVGVSATALAFDSFLVGGGGAGGDGDLLDASALGW